MHMYSDGREVYQWPIEKLVQSSPLFLTVDSASARSRKGGGEGGPIVSFCAAERERARNVDFGVRLPQRNGKVARERKRVFRGGEGEK